MTSGPRFTRGLLVLCVAPILIHLGLTENKTGHDKHVKKTSKKGSAKNETGWDPNELLEDMFQHEVHEMGPDKDFKNLSHILHSPSDDDDEFEQTHPLPREPILIHAYLKMHHIVPKILPRAPKAALEVTYGKDAMVDFGMELTEEQVEKPPTNMSWPTEKGAHYTLIFFTPDSPSRLNQTEGQFVFWFVANINESCMAKSGNVYTEYLGPKPWTMIPEQYTELRRYIYIVYKQPEKPLLYRMGITYKEYYDSRQRFNMSAFATEYKLGPPVAANFFQMSVVKQKRNWTVLPEFIKDPMRYLTVVDEPTAPYPHDY